MRSAGKSALAASFARRTTTCRSTRITGSGIWSRSLSGAAGRSCGSAAGPALGGALSRPPISTAAPTAREAIATAGQSSPPRQAAKARSAVAAMSAPISRSGAARNRGGGRRLGRAIAELRHPIRRLIREKRQAFRRSRTITSTPAISMPLGRRRQVADRDRLARDVDEGILALDEEVVVLARVGVEIGLGAVDRELAQQPGFGELVQRVVDGRERDRDARPASPRRTGPRR